MKSPEWATGYRENGGPADTPHYLLRDYPRMLAATGDANRLSMLACDSARHDRMLNLTGGDALALDEVVLAQSAGLLQDPPDLVTAANLALHREELSPPQHGVPVGLPAVWAMLGK